MDKFKLLKIFVTVVDQGNFVGAASTLALSPSAVSKAISRLEQELQVQLIFRTTRSITLTESGREYAAYARQLMQDLADCENRLQGKNQQARGLLRVNLPVSYGRQYVVPMLKDFTEQYTDIKLQISFEDGYLDMIENGIDVTIRTGTLEDSSMVARQLSPMDFLVCAAPAYLKQHKKITPDDYPQHPWVRFRFKQSGRLNPVMIKKGKRIEYSDPRHDFIVDDGEAAASLSANGMGLVQLPHFVAKQWIDSGKLSVISPFVRAPKFGVWMIYAKREYLPLKIKVFTDFLEARIRTSGETPRSTWAEKYA